MRGHRALHVLLWQSRHRGHHAAGADRGRPARCGQPASVFVSELTEGFTSFTDGANASLIAASSVVKRASSSLSMRIGSFDVEAPSVPASSLAGARKKLARKPLRAPNRPTPAARMNTANTLPQVLVGW